MKRTAFLSAFLLLAMMSFAQSAQPAQDFAIAQIDNLTHDFGKIKQGAPVTHEFTFVNKGKVPLIITNASPSCGCTVPSWTRDPIPPGGSGNVKATFNAAAAGAFDKTITVMANVEGGVILLHIRGEVQSPVPNK
jgi:hypothetical protein